MRRARRTCTLSEARRSSRARGRRLKPVLRPLCAPRWHMGDRAGQLDPAFDRTIGLTRLTPKMPTPTCTPTPMPRLFAQAHDSGDKLTATCTRPMPTITWPPRPVARYWLYMAFYEKAPRDHAAPETSDFFAGSGSRK
jgi:hypothetical protein